MSLNIQLNERDDVIGLGVIQNVCYVNSNKQTTILFAFFALPIACHPYNIINNRIYLHETIISSNFIRFGLDNRWFTARCAKMKLPPESPQYSLAVAIGVNSLVHLRIGAIRLHTLPLQNLRLQTTSAPFFFSFLLNGDYLVPWL